MPLFLRDQDPGIAPAILIDASFAACDVSPSDSPFAGSVEFRGEGSSGLAPAAEVHAEMAALLAAAADTDGLAEWSEASSGVARIELGRATFAEADSTLMQKISAVEAAFQLGGCTRAGQTAAFSHGGERYVFIANGTDGLATGDLVVRLVGAHAGPDAAWGHADLG